MKKSILVMLTAMLALTGCDDKNESGENAAESVVSESTADNSSETLSLTAEEIEEKCLEFVGNYYDGTKEADFDKCFGNFPDFYLEMLEKEVEVCEQTHEEYMQSIYDDYVQMYGDDFEIKFQVSDDENGTKGILSLESSIDEFKDILKETYDRDVNLEEAYTIYITTVTTGSLDSYNVQEEWYLLKIDGEYYLYENYYESNPIE